MGTGWLFTVVNDLVSGTFTGVWTLLSWPLGSIIVLTLAFAVVGLIIYFVKKAMNS